MVVGMLSSLLSGAAYGTESGNMVDGAKVGSDGDFFMAMDIAAFDDIERVKERVDGVIAEVHRSRRARDTDRLFVPGEIEAEFEAGYTRDGILLTQDTIAGIALAAKSFNVGGFRASS